MDERKKIIKQLESQNKDAQGSINLLLERLGETLLVRIEEQMSLDLDQQPGDSEAGQAPIPVRDRLAEAVEYRRLHKEITDSQAQIAAIEAAMLRLKELEERITQKEQDHAEKLKELTERSVRLGKLILEEPALEDLSGSYKRQIEVLIPKIQSLEDRLEKLEEKNRSHIFAWIGKSAQGMVLRSFLENSQESLRRLYGSLGEQFVLPPDRVIAHEEILALVQDIGALRTGAARITEEITNLKTACRGINETFGPEGSPIKQIQDLEKHIAHVRGELKIVYLKVGRKTTYESSAVQFSDLLKKADILLLDEVKTIQETMQNTERHIEKLHAALAIDHEKEEIEKMQKVIQEHRRRIAVSEEAIGDLEKRITDANQRIETLTLFL